MNEPPTQHLPAKPVPDPDDKNRQISARLAAVERNQIDLRSRLDDLFLQFMSSRQQDNELSRDLATSTREKLIESIETMKQQRKEITTRKIKAETATEVLLLDMADDTLRDQIERTHSELERVSKVVANKSSAIVRDSEKIEAIKLNKPEPAEKQIGKPAWWTARFDRIADAFLLVLAWAVMQEWVLPLINKAFGP